MPALHSATGLQVPSIGISGYSGKGTSHHHRTGNATERVIDNRDVAGFALATEVPSPMERPT